MKKKLRKAKDWYANQLKANPQETIAGSLTLVASIIGLGVKINDSSVSRSKAKTWKREVERRERKQKESSN